MSVGQSILCLSPDPWGGIWRNRQHIMGRLARNNRIVLVEPQRKLVGAFARRNMKRHQIPDNLEVVTPPLAVPFGAGALPTAVVRCLAQTVARINNALLASFLKRYMRGHGIHSPILWMYDPMHADLAGRLGEGLLVYQVHDDVASFPFNSKIRGIISKRDRLLLSRADLVFECSRSRYEADRSISDRVHYVPNGGDFAHFQKALDPASSIPAEMRNIRRPMIAYYGTMDFRLDVELLSYLARERPLWSFVLLGQDNFGRHNGSLDLYQLENVHFIGTREYEVLPAYLKSFDVVIFPYKVPGYMGIASAPLKLYECLAAGKPLVTTPLPILSPEREVVRIADTYRGFLTAVDDALVNRDDERTAKGIEIARWNSWDSRVEQMSSLIEEKLQGKGCLVGA